MKLLAIGAHPDDMKFSCMAFYQHVKIKEMIFFY